MTQKRTTKAWRFLVNSLAGEFETNGPCELTWQGMKVTVLAGNLATEFFIEPKPDAKLGTLRYLPAGRVRGACAAYAAQVRAAPDVLGRFVATPAMLERLLMLAVAGKQ